MELNLQQESACRYILAGSDSFCGLQNDFIAKHQNNHYSYEKLNTFLLSNVDKFLYSFGSFLNYRTKTFKDNYNEKVEREVERITSNPMMKTCKHFIDSGGYQCSMGAISTEKMPLFIELYHQFIKDNHHKFTYAFNLDLPPGPGSSDIFQSFKQIEDLNRLSYQTTSKLPQNIKDLMIYIHHFRTPSLQKMYNKFLFEEDLADGFTCFGTGGIVANMATDLVMPLIIYSIPLSDILKYNIQKKKKAFKFHVLGGANFPDLVWHCLFSHHIKKVHDIDVTITYDSSSIFKGLAQGRIIPVFKDNGDLDKMDIRSCALEWKFEKDITIEDKLYLIMNEFSRIYNFKELNKKDDPIYDEERNTFSRSTYMYLFNHVFYMYKKIETIAQEFVEETYPFYENNNFEEFDKRIYNIYRRFNNGKSSRKQKAKSSSVIKSLEILTNCDEEYNKYVINKFMSSDDMSSMVDDGVLKF